MGVFKPSVLTQKGASLSAEVMAGKKILQFTKIVLGDERLTGDLSTRTNIGRVRQFEYVTAVNTTDEHNVVTYADFSNRSLPMGYYVRTIGLYAYDTDEDGGEILYSISVADESEATADWMPPFKNEGLTSYHIGIAVAVSNTSQVHISITDPEFVPMGVFNAHHQNKNNPHGVTAEQAGAVQKTIFGYTPSGEDSLIGVINELIGRGYTQGLIQIATEEDVRPTDTPTNISHYAFCKYRKHGNNYVEVELTDDGTLTTYLNKFIYTTDRWMFNWLEVVNHAGYLPLDGSVAMQGGITIGSGQAKFASNEYIATINAYKDPEDPTKAYRSLWVSNDGDIKQTVKAIVKEADKETYTEYSLFGAHNKPTGTYVGNGTKTQREINTGGIGNALLIYRNDKSALVLPSCAIFCSNGVLEATWDVTFKNGSLTMQTISDYVNGDGIEYKYQVL